MPVDLCSDGHYLLVLPDAKDQPALSGEGGRGAIVSDSVGGKLVLPPLRVRPWSDGVIRTAVPKASIDEDRDPRPAENHIGPARQPAHIDLEAQPAAVQLAAQCDLRPRSGAAQGGHEATDRWGRGGRPARGDLAISSHG